MNKGFSANATLHMFTIPARIVRQSPDPDGHTEWLVRGLTKDKILNGPGYPQPVPKFPGNVIVKSTPTMGKGVFATRDIPRDGVIFAERRYSSSHAAKVNNGSKKRIQSCRLYEDDDA